MVLFSTSVIRLTAADAHFLRACSKLTVINIIEIINPGVLSTISLGFGINLIFVICFKQFYSCDFWCRDIGEGFLSVFLI